MFVDPVFVRKTHLFGNEQPVPAEAPDIRSLSSELASRNKPKVAGDHPQQRRVFCELRVGILTS